MRKILDPNGWRPGWAMATFLLALLVSVTGIVATWAKIQVFTQAFAEDWQVAENSGRLKTTMERKGEWREWMDSGGYLNEKDKEAIIQRIDDRFDNLEALLREHREDLREHRAINHHESKN